MLPAGTRLTGVVTSVDDSGRVKGRAGIAFNFTSLRTGDARYDLQAAPLSRLAPATKSEDATTIGIGAGAGAVIGGLLGGKDGAAKGAAVGGGAGTGVVLATKGREVRLAPGADVTTQLTASLTVRVVSVNALIQRLPVAFTPRPMRPSAPPSVRDSSETLARSMNGRSSAQVTER